MAFLISYKEGSLTIVGVEGEGGRLMGGLCRVACVSTGGALLSWQLPRGEGLLDLLGSHAILFHQGVEEVDHYG